jgi:putative ABC transport system permease protein
MKRFTDLVPKYLTVHRKKTRLVVMGIAVSVALITGVFSMLDSLQKFEVMEMKKDQGNYHLRIKDPSDKEISFIRNRIDVQNYGLVSQVAKVTSEEVKCGLFAIDEAFAPNAGVVLLEGRYPAGNNEAIIEKWATGEAYLGATVGDTIRITLPDKKEKEFTVSGMIEDSSSMKSKGIPGIIITVEASRNLGVKAMSSTLYIEMKKGVNVLKAEKGIKKALGMDNSRMGRNEYLLAVMGQSDNKDVYKIYLIGVVLFFIVLVAGVVMIYNTFNISVMERVRQFGLLRCIGASRSQVRQLVLKEAFLLMLRGIPLGVLAGFLITLLCMTVLKYYNSKYYEDIAIFQPSLIGLAAGVLIGILTVFTASLLPAKKASRVSPVSAVSGNSEVKPRKRVKRGLLTRMFHVETAMGINNAAMKKKTLFLMSCSIAISIILFLGFQVLIDFMYGAMKTTKPYTADMTIVSDHGLDKKMLEKVAAIDGVKRVFGRMFGYVDATFSYDRLTEDYKKMMGGIDRKPDGGFDAPETSWLISYDKNQLSWAKQDLIEGSLDEEKLNANNGVVAVMVNLRNNITTETAALQIGDVVHVKTPSGAKDMKVMGILRAVPFGDSKLNLDTFITTEKIFTELTGETSYRILDIQVENRSSESTANEVKALADKSMRIGDFRQKNTEVNQTFMTMAVFVYGFIILIGLISVVNVINTMSTSIASKTRYLGVMRAVGMDGGQLNRMVLTEAATYCVLGSVSGCALGLLLQWKLSDAMPARLHINWDFPVVQIGIILVTVLLVTVISVISPLRRIKERGINEVVGSLQN